MNRFNEEFGRLVKKHECFKTDVTENGFMAVSNLDASQGNDHAKRICDLALDMVGAANNIFVDPARPESGFVPIRLAMHTGPVVADVVGGRNPRYCLFGGTLTTVSLLAKESEAFRINCSERTAELLRVQAPQVELKSHGKYSRRGESAKECFWVSLGAISESKFALSRVRAKQRLRQMQALQKCDEDSPSHVKVPDKKTTPETPSKGATTTSDRKVRFGSENNTVLQVTTSPSDQANNEKEDLVDLEENLMNRLSRTSNGSVSSGSF